ncbi:hypothetical protein [Limisphaera sp. VF-2]|jgi:hypothetical protein|uniref:hypothetical protein n=1 Tax=Limisphaera sp. VF-2 TaxID=3400418 RepID=UPI003C20F8C3
MSTSWIQLCQRAKLAFSVCPYQHHSHADQQHRIYPALLRIPDTLQMSHGRYPDIIGIEIYDANNGKPQCHKDRSWRYKRIPSGQTRNILGTPNADRQARSRVNQQCIDLHQGHVVPGAYYCDGTHLHAYAHYFDALIYASPHSARHLECSSQLVLIAYSLQQNAPAADGDAAKIRALWDSADRLAQVCPYEDLWDSGMPIQSYVLKLEKLRLVHTNGYPGVQGVTIYGAQGRRIPRNDPVLRPSGHVRELARGKTVGEWQNRIWEFISHREKRLITGAFVATTEGVCAFAHEVDCVFVHAYAPQLSPMQQLLALMEKTKVSMYQGKLLFEVVGETSSPVVGRSEWINYMRARRPGNPGVMITPEVPRMALVFTNWMRFSECDEHGDS